MARVVCEHEKRSTGARHSSRARRKQERVWVEAGNNFSRPQMGEVIGVTLARRGRRHTVDRRDAKIKTSESDGER